MRSKNPFNLHKKHECFYRLQNIKCNVCVRERVPTKKQEHTDISKSKQKDRTSQKI